jgi:hypothetical protein
MRTIRSLHKFGLSLASCVAQPLSLVQGKRQIHQTKPKWRRKAENSRATSGCCSQTCKTELVTYLEVDNLNALSVQSCVSVNQTLWSVRRGHRNVAKSESEEALNLAGPHAAGNRDHPPLAPNPKITNPTTNIYTFHNSTNNASILTAVRSFKCPRWARYNGTNLVQSRRRCGC